MDVTENRKVSTTTNETELTENIQTVKLAAFFFVCPYCKFETKKSVSMARVKLLARFHLTAMHEKTESG